MPNNVIHPVSGSPATAGALSMSWCPPLPLLRRALLLSAVLSPAAGLRVGTATSPIAGCKGIECVERYVQLPDASYSWKDTGLQLSGTDLRSNTTWRGYVLNMTSQTWKLSGTPVGFPLWWHVLIVVVPANREIADWSNLLLDFGVNHLETSSITRFDNRITEETQRRNPGIAVDWDNLPSHLGDLKKAIEKAAYIATRTRALAAALYQLPNGYETFSDDTEHRARTADGVRGFAFSSFLRHPEEPERMMELPVTKAVVRAMDTITAFASQRLGGLAVSRFGVTGYSKLGTATMLSAAVDPRVKVIAPIAAQLHMDDTVYPKLTKPGLRVAMAAAELGFLNKMIMAYEDLIVNQIDQTPAYGKLHSIVDPSAWVSRLTVPQFWAVASDDTVLPGVTELAGQRLPQLPKGTNFLELPGCTHEDSLVTALPSIAAFLRGKILGLPSPQVTYEKEQLTGRLVVRQASNHTPLRALLWESSTAPQSMVQMSKAAQRRGFRSRELEETSPGSRTWAATSALPVSFIMLEYDWPEPGMEPFRISTPAFHAQKKGGAAGSGLLQLLLKRSVT